MLLLQNVWTGDKGVRLSHYTHILKLLSLVLVFFKDVIVTECVERGRRCLVICLYPHINIVINYNPGL